MDAGTDAALCRPGTQQILDHAVELLAQRQRVVQARQRAQVGKPVLKEQLREYAPVERVVPDHLDRQHHGVAKQRVLVGIERQRVGVERLEQLLVDLRVRTDRPARAVAADQLGDVGVADRNEVAAGRIKRVEKDPRLAGQGPTLR